jgi:molecular chaperone DnaJ
MATTERDYYEILGVARGATDAEIKRSFRRLARELHPDVSDVEDAEARFKEVAEAYEVLSNPETRELYDRYGVAGLQRGGGGPAAADFGNIADVFSAFFGEGMFGQRTSGRPQRGADVTATVEISLGDVLTGTTITVPLRVAVECDTCGGNGAAPGTSATTCRTCGGAGQVQRVTQSVFGQVLRAGTCPDCEGAGRIIEHPCESCDGAGRTVETREIEVEVPAGIHDGQRIRLRGEGHAGALGGPRGDAFVLVRVRSSDRLVRDGDDLVAAVDITMTQAALGGTVSISLPDGDVEVEIPAGTQPGDVRVVRGHGLPSLGGGRRGDLRARVAVRVPRALTPEQRVLLEQLGATLGDDAYKDDDGFFDRLKSAFR